MPNNSQINTHGIDRINRSQSRSHIAQNAWDQCDYSDVKTCILSSSSSKKMLRIGEICCFLPNMSILRENCPVKCITVHILRIF